MVPVWKRILSAFIVLSFVCLMVSSLVHGMDHKHEHDSNHDDCAFCQLCPSVKKITLFFTSTISFSADLLWVEIISSEGFSRPFLYTSIIPRAPPY